MAKPPKFPHRIGNWGRGTQWLVSFGADTMFHRTYF